MKSKIISLPGRHFERRTQKPLTRLMIVALIEACEKQSKGLLFGPNSIHGSFTALIKRGLMVTKQVTLDNQKEATWQVTAEAIQMLRALGINLPC
jgi:hypothetical protein